MEAIIAFTLGSRKASFMSFARNSGLFERISCAALALGNSFTFKPRDSRARKPFSYEPGNTLGHAQEGETIATVSQTLNLLGFIERKGRS